MAQLAIRGHATRGKEVVEILAMLGGRCEKGYSAGGLDCYYYISDNGAIDNWYYLDEDCFITFTLEEFLEKFPYKVGDKVLLEGVVKTIKQACWDNTENEVIYKLETNVRGFSEEYYVHNYDLQPYKEETMEEIKIDIPKGYEFAGVDDDKQQVVFTKIQPEYPKTYEECCKIMEIHPSCELALFGRAATKREIPNCAYAQNLLKKINKFQKLLICRDAYWKLAGEQMGLGKPWSPSKYENVYCIFRYKGDIVKDNFVFGDSLILEFPTEEMRDAFYEHFKDLIEQCKELL